LSAVVALAMGLGPVEALSKGDSRTGPALGGRDEGRAWVVWSDRCGSACPD
jgi:hypothetical protein